METISQKKEKLKTMCRDLTLLYANESALEIVETVEYFEEYFGIVEVATDVDDAFERFTKNNHDLVIIGGQTILNDTNDLIGKLREFQNGQNIIVCIEDSDATYLTKILSCGANGYILKPIEETKLLNELTRVVEQVKESKRLLSYEKYLEEVIKEKTKEEYEHFIKDEQLDIYNRNHLKGYLIKNIYKALILFNIDNFSIFNDSYGVDFGDEILKEVAKNFKKLTPDNGKLFRIGGDEFAILLLAPFENQAEDVAMEIRAFFMENHIEIDTIEIQITFTIGIDYGYNKDLLRNTTIAVREIREIGKNRIHLYDKSSVYQERQRHNINCIARIKTGICDEGFFPHFQPVIDNRDGSITSYECLARLNDNGKIVLPYDFLLPAKNIGLLSSITRQIIDKSFAFFAQQELRFSINIADYDLKEGYLVKFMEQKLNKYGINPQNVSLEIIETITVQDSKEWLKELALLKNIGFRIVIDDFGGENSNFSKLIELEIDGLKIDGKLIGSLHTNPINQKIVANIVKYGESIGVDVVAKYVQTQEIFETLKGLGVKHSQGFLFGEPKVTV